MNAPQQADAPAGASLGEALRAAARRLTEAGIEGAALDARVLAGHATGESASGLIARAHRALSAEETMRLDALIERRLGREPVAQIVGVREFWSLPFRVSGEVLTPRPESETIVEAACARWPGREAPLRILDLGTGSGCLLLALLHEYPHATGHGRDRSPAALAIARGNAGALGFGERAHFSAGDWADGIEGAFDLVVANPPYIESAACETLAPEVARHEPRAALDGGEDGLDAYRAIVPALAGILAADGLALLEVGSGQAPAVAALAEPNGLTEMERHRDLAGIERVVALALPGRR